MSKRYRHSCGYLLCKRQVWNGLALYTQFIDGDVGSPTAGEDISSCPSCGESLGDSADWDGTVMTEAIWQKRNKFHEEREKRERLADAAPALFEACEMGLDGELTGPAMLREAAKMLRPVLTKGLGYFADALDAKAAAEEAALKTAGGE